MCLKILFLFEIKCENIYFIKKSIYFVVCFKCFINIRVYLKYKFYVYGFVFEVDKYLIYN